METITAILERAQLRAREMNLPYEGALLPAEALTLLQEAPDAKLVDVRSRAEWDWVEEFRARLKSNGNPTLVCRPIPLFSIISQARWIRNRW